MGPDDGTLAGAPPAAARTALAEVTIRIAGDSGDGIQVAGAQLTTTSALAGNDIATMPDYPAEIRAPIGTLAGVSGFQIQFSSHAVMTPGDQADVLVAFNPAALKMNLRDLRRGGVVIANRDAFDETNFRKAGIAANPLEDGTLEGYRVYAVDLTRLTREALKDSGLSAREVDRAKNFFALGMLYWLYGRSLEPTERWIAQKFADEPALAAANARVLAAGRNYAETVRIFQTVYEVAPAPLPPGRYRNLDGNEAIALALAAIAERNAIPVLLGTYPITPASTVLHHVTRLRAFGVGTFQAEDEIAGIGAALGASFAGGLGVTTTSGPGLALKTEICGLAVMTELPLLVIDIQRGGPSTGLPTKTEQADLLMAIFGRPGEAPLPVLAAASPGDCFWMTLEAARLAVKYMTPVILLSEGYLANGAEPWRVPDPDEIPLLPIRQLGEGAVFEGSYARDPRTLARPWVPPGTPGLEHRIGGLEKDAGGRVSYDPDNHARMVALRRAKIDGIADDIPPARLEEGEVGDPLLVVGWGATYGAITQAVRELRADGVKVASLHLRHLNPLPHGLAELLQAFPRILCPELNLGQLQWLLQARCRVVVEGLHKVEGRPFRVAEIKDAVRAALAS